MHRRGWPGPHRSHPYPTSIGNRSSPGRVREPGSQTRVTNPGILPSDQRTLATLTEQSQRLHRLVGDLSAVSRAEERQLNLHPVLVSAEDLVSGAVEAARPRFDAKGISLTADGAESGIGLTIAKAIVQAHHGQLLGHSDGPGKGARFEITLPIAGRGATTTALT